MIILVTGAASFVGCHIVRKLVAEGQAVRAVVRSVDKAEKRLGAYKDQIEIIQGLRLKRDDWPALMDGVSVVIHTVSITMEKKGLSYEAINYQGAVNVMDAAVARGVPRFINVSHNGADAASPYRFYSTKGRAQEYLARSGLAWTSLRPSAVFGPEDEFFNTFAHLLKICPVVFPLISRENLFQPVSVYDLAEVAVRCLDDESTIGQDFAIGGPEVLSLGEIEKRIVGALGAKRIFVPVPMKAVRPVVFAMEHTLRGSPVNSGLLDLLSVPNVVPNNALIDYFHVQPIAFKAENLSYLSHSSFGDVLKKFLHNAVPH